MTILIRLSRYGRLATVHGMCASFVWTKDRLENTNTAGNFLSTIQRFRQMTGCLRLQIKTKQGNFVQNLYSKRTHKIPFPRNVIKFLKLAVETFVAFAITFSLEFGNSRNLGFSGDSLENLEFLASP